MAAPEPTDPADAAAPADTDVAGAGAGAVDPDADVADLGYEAARDELVRIVAQLEGGQVSLEESMRMWQRAERLAERCESWLARAESAVGTASADDGG